MQLYLDSEMEEVAAQMKAAGTFGDDFDIFTFRGIFEQISPLMWDRDSMPVHKVKDIMVPVNGTELAVRIYWPRESDTPLPVLLFFHGGGYTSGSVNTSDAHSRFFCREADCIVVNADYRLAPEHPFPTGVEDTFAMADWAAANCAAFGGDPDRLAIGGDAPGGSYATVNTIRARDNGGPKFIYQILLGPSADFSGHYPEKDLYLKLGNIGPKALEVLEKAYLPNPEARKDWRCSPLLAPDLSNLPPAFILSAQYDFLRPEVDAYVARLREAGVPVCYQVWPGVLHNFFSQCSQLEIARVAMRNAAAQLRKALHS
jgi:acetyl esterase